MTKYFDVGEMGWAIGCLAPHLRWRAGQGEQIVVACPPDRAFLYADFAETVPLWLAPDTSDGLRGEVAEGLQPTDADRAWLAQLEEADLAHIRRRGPAPEKLWLRYGPVDAVRSSVCVAFRPRKTYCGNRWDAKAWPLNRCEELVARLQDAGLRVTAVGGSDNWPAGADLDLRGRPLDEQVDALARSAVCVGPSSAPLHLAQLCGAPVVTWYGLCGTRARRRYESAWNPFGAASTWICDERQPQVDEVVGAAARVSR